MRSAARRTLQSGLVPLLDTLFLLLFGLMAVAQVRDDAREPVRVELPAVEPGVDGAVADAALGLEVDRDGALRAAGSDAVLTDRAALDAALAAALGARLPDEVSVEIRADRAAPHGAAVELLQHLRLAGYTRVSLLAVGEPAAGGALWSARE